MERPLEKRRLGRTDLTIAPLVFGGNVFGWTADEKTSFDLLDRFAAAGLNAVDTADVYSDWAPGNKGGESETIIGKWMKSRGNRDKTVVITKVGSDLGEGRKGLSAAYIERAVEASLKRLQTDVIDLYLSHWPDKSVPYDETLGAYQRLIAKGKIRYAGASNLDAGQLSAALKVASQKSLPRYEVLQPEYNLYDRSSFDGALLDLCVKEEIGVITYFSLARGFLSGKYRSEADLGKSPRGGGVEQVSQSARLPHPCGARRCLGAAFGHAGGGGARLGHRAARHHRADRQRHDAAAGRQPDPRRLVEAQPLGYQRAGRGQRSLSQRRQISTPSSPSRLTAVGGSGGGFCDLAASTSSSSQAASVSADQPLDEFLAIEAGLDRLQEPRLDRAGIAHEFAPRPVEAGDMRDRHDRHAELRIKLDDAVFVGRLVARRTPRAFGIDDQLAVMLHLPPGRRHHRLQRLGAAAAVDRDHPHLGNVPAEERDPHQFALQDVERVAQIGKEGDRIPEGLVLRGEDERACGEVFGA